MPGGVRNGGAFLRVCGTLCAHRGPHLRTRQAFTDSDERVVASLYIYSHKIFCARRRVLVARHRDVAPCRALSRAVAT